MTPLVESLVTQAYLFFFEVRSTWLQDGISDGNLWLVIYSVRDDRYVRRLISHINIYNRDELKLAISSDYRFKHEGYSKAICSVVITKSICTYNYVSFKHLVVK